MKLACLQLEVVFNDPAANAEKAVRHLEELSREAVDLAIFPEAFLTGYCVSSAEEANLIATGLSAVEPIQAACERLGITAILGLARKTEGVIKNTAVLIEPGSELRLYDKTHLPELGLDKFVVAGDSLPVFETRHGRIGMLICFDLRFPEASRVLALRGADLIVLPTNWPEGAETSAESHTVARASENRIFLAACNRVGEENGFRFIGKSKIVSPTGAVLAAAGQDETVLCADLDVSQARVKRNVMIPGKYETTVFESRRPDLYHEITARRSAGEGA